LALPKHREATVVIVGRGGTNITDDQQPAMPVIVYLNGASMIIDSQSGKRA